MSVINVTINGIEITGQAGQTVLELAKSADIFIPTLCHDDRTRAYGSCGICVVEAEGMPRLIRACSTAASDGMKIHTDTERVLKVRKTILELLLSDHTGDCRPPCVKECPAQTDCQGYVGLIANGNYRAAAELIKEKLPLPSSIGRICPHPCENACRRELVEEPVNIAGLKYFVSDLDLNSDNAYTPDVAADTGKRVAVIGGGPGGLSAAYFLRKMGHSVCIYEQMPEMGGMLRYGVPEYRLPREVLAKEAGLVEKLGVEFKNNFKIGRDAGFDEIREANDAVILAIGAWNSTKLGCPGEELDGVVGGIDFLRESALKKPEEKIGTLNGKRVAVVGGGNVAMDACRTAVRLGAETVYNIYRRTVAEMPAEKIEIDEALEEGVVFLSLTNPIEILSNNGKASGVRLQKMELGEPDASGRRAPVPIPGDEMNIDVDLVISAIGQIVNVSGFESVSTTKRRTIQANEKTFETNIPGVFAVGDAINKGADIAVSAIGAARKAALAADLYMNGEPVSIKEEFLVEQEITAEDLADKPKQSRENVRHLPAEKRKTCFDEVNFAFTEETAKKEASRCLECGCLDYFECRLIDYANRYAVQPGKFAGEQHKRGKDERHEYITRNPDKCVLCGLCARMCDEVMGVGALGLVGRGFGTEVKPAMAMPLCDTDCASCGQCVSLCPTGALTEKNSARKSVPVRETLISTVCTHCGDGCLIKAAVVGNEVVRVLPDTEADPDCVLCEKGRFGFSVRKQQTIVITDNCNPPSEAQGAEDQDSVMNRVYKRFDDIISKHGRDSIGVSVSAKLTCEEMSAAKKHAEERLQTTRVFSFDFIESGLAEVTGRDQSTGTFDDISGAENIVVFAPDIIKSNPAAAYRVKQAVSAGAKLILVGAGQSPVNEWASGSYSMDEGLETIKTLKNAVIIFDQAGIQKSDAALIAKNAGDNKIIQLKPFVNSQGLSDSSITTPPADVIGAIKRGEIKGLLVYGNLPENADFVTGLEFICVISRNNSAPGTLIRYDGKTQTFTPVL